MVYLGFQEVIVIKFMSYIQVLRYFSFEIISGLVYKCVIGLILMKH